MKTRQGRHLFIEPVFLLLDQLARSLLIGPVPESGDAGILSQDIDIPAVFMPLHEAAPQRRRDTKTQAQARQSVEFRQRPDDEQVIPVPGLVQDGIGFVRGKEIEERFIDEDICSLAGADFGQGQDFIGRRQGARRYS